MLHVFVLLANHIHVCLENNAFVVLVAWGGRDTHDDIEGFVLIALNVVLLGKID